MKLDLTAREEAVRDLQLDTPPEEIELVPPGGYQVLFDRNVSVRVAVRRVGEEFFIRGEAHTLACYTCVRCLKEYRADLDAELDVIVHRVTAPEGGGADVESYVEVPLGATEFDLSPHVREALILALPQTPHCTETCRGLCAHCGADLNKETCSCLEKTNDPRWDALRTLSSVEK